MPFPTLPIISNQSLICRSIRDAVALLTPKIFCTLELVTLPLILGFYQVHSLVHLLHKSTVNLVLKRQIAFVIHADTYLASCRIGEPAYPLQIIVQPTFLPFYILILSETIQSKNYFRQIFNSEQTAMKVWSAAPDLLPLCL